MRVTNISQLMTVMMSAAFYAASFLFQKAWFFNFASFAVLFSVRSASYNSSLWLGFVWGLIGFGLVNSAHIDLIVRLSNSWHGYWYAWCALFYWALLSSLWFCMSKKRGWLLSTILFFAFLVQGAWFPLIGRWMGYGVVCPLIPVMQEEQLLGLLPYLGWEGMRMLFFLVAWAIAEKRGIITFLGAVPFLVGLFLPVKKNSELIECAFVQERFYEDRPYERAQELCLALIKTQHKQPNASLILFPESAFPYPFEEHSYVGAMLQGNLKDETTELLVGTHHKNQEKFFNVVYSVRKSRITPIYVKRLLLPFLEEQGSDNPLLKNIHKEFLQNKTVFSPGVLEQKPYFFLGSSIVVRVCSELLWDIPFHSTVVVLVHDGYYRFAYYPRLFKQFAAFQALRTSSKLLYSGWIEAGCFDHKG